MVCMVPACLWTYLHSTILIPIYSSSSFASSCWLLRISSVITFSLICRCVWQSNGTYEQILHYKKVAWEWLQLFLFLTVSDCPKDFLGTSRTLVIQFYNTQFYCIEGKSSKRRKVICSSFWSKNFLCRQQIKKSRTHCFLFGTLSWRIPQRILYYVAPFYQACCKVSSSINQV